MRALVLLAYDIPRARTVIGPGERLAPLWDLAAMRKLFLAVLPLGLTTALISLNSNLPRYFIDGVLGADELGYFAAVAYLVLAASLVIGSLARAAMLALGPLSVPVLDRLEGDARLVFSALTLMAASGLGLATSVAYWLTFNPTAGYARWVERRYRPAAP